MCPGEPAFLAASAVDPGATKGDTLPEIGVYLIVAVASLVVGYFIRILLARMTIGTAEVRKNEILKNAEKEGERIQRDAEISAKGEVLKLREEFEQESKEAQKEMRQTEHRVAKRETDLDRKMEMIERKERHLDTSERKLSSRLAKVQEKTDELLALVEKEKETLLEISGMSVDQATSMLLSRLEKDLERESADLINKRQQRVREEVRGKATELLLQAMQRVASDHTAEAVVAAVDIPNDEMKGRIIGREGRNIRAFEKATGVDVIVDDTPGVVVVSCFDSIRREVARRGMSRLIEDGRIHPARIEEVIHQTKRELDETLRDVGKKVCYELNLVGLNNRILVNLGRLQFRVSRNMNVLRHCVEVAQLSGLIAGELGLNVALAKRCGLLHDIGKALDHDVEGSHAQAGAEFARRCEEKKVVQNAIAAHHDEVNLESMYAAVVQVANAISASRPGLEDDNLEKYIKRMERLEAVSNSYLGIESSFAIQAGRELRVVADSSKVDDRLAVKLARDIANEIEEQLSYPGEVRVTLVRETRIVDYAK